MIFWKHWDYYPRYITLAIITIGIAFVVVKYNTFFIREDYIVIKQIPCHVNNASCFVSKCESNDSTCNPTEKYLKIKVQAKYAGSDYESLLCAGSDPHCQIITCEDSTIEPGEQCFQ